MEKLAVFCPTFLYRPYLNTNSSQWQKMTRDRPDLRFKDLEKAYDLYQFANCGKLQKTSQLM